MFSACNGDQGFHYLKWFIEIYVSMTDLIQVTNVLNLIMFRNSNIWIIFCAVRLQRVVEESQRDGLS